MVELAGPCIEQILARDGHLDLQPEGFPVGTTRGMIFAHIPVQFLRTATHQWLLLIERSFLGYFAE